MRVAEVVGVCWSEWVDDSVGWDTDAVPPDNDCDRAVPLKVAVDGGSIVGVNSGDVVVLFVFSVLV